MSLNKGPSPNPFDATQPDPAPDRPPYQQIPVAYRPPGYPVPGYPPPGPPQPGWYPTPPQRSNRLAYLITGVALVCVLALVLGGVLWWKLSSSDGGSDDTPSLVAGQLTGSFPTGRVPPGASMRVRSVG
ncbi:hypothetical protein AB4Z55_21435 [Gordonia sp. ABKF26]|uniref:hypothetical protein n=1 Tax=Gordonia sp. ABKF26 TaxID=3238687 RepID=UPI0034E37848